MPRRIAHQALVEAHARLLALFAELDGHTQLELPRIVQQQHTERPIVDDTLDELCDPGQELVEIEDRCQLAPDLGERLEGLGVLTLPLEQPGMLERDGHERREVAEQRHVHFVEGVLLEPENVERADHPRLVDQRHDECRPHARHQVLVARVPGDVLAQHRAPLGHRRPDEPFPHSQPNALRNPRRVAERIGDPKLLTGRVEEIDGKGVEPEHPAQQLVDLAEQLVEVEDRGHLLREIQQGL